MNREQREVAATAAAAEQHQRSSRQCTVTVTATVSCIGYFTDLRLLTAAAAAAPHRSNRDWSLGRVINTTAVNRSVEKYDCETVIEGANQPRLAGQTVSTRGRSVVRSNMGCFATAAATAAASAA